MKKKIKMSSMDLRKSLYEITSAKPLLSADQMKARLKRVR
jgi:hypothetical protein